MTGDQQQSGRLPPEHPNGIRRIQVGCGPHHILTRWWNVDIRGFSGIDETMDVTKPWRWKGIIDYVYGEHFLEHLSLRGALLFLVESGNALRVGGRLRLSTPSLEWVVASHFDLDETDVSKKIYDTIKINRAFHGWGHRFLYSKAILEKIFKELGFIQIEFYEYRQSSDINLRNLERHSNHENVMGLQSVHIIEAEKGGDAIVLREELSEFLSTNYIRYVESGH